MLVRILTVLVLLFMLSSCTDQRSPQDRPPTAADSASKPDTELRGAIIYHYEHGLVTTEIRADSIKEFGASDSTMAYNLDVDFFDSAGQITSNLVGDSGISRETKGQITVFSNVVLLTYDSARHASSKLIGDSIITLENGQHLTIYDHVVAIRESDNLRIQTDSLVWNPIPGDSFPVKTDAFVRFTTSTGTSWDGWGMVTDRDLSIIRTGEGSGTVNISDTAGLSE